MRILFLQQQPCIRALKYAAALKGAGGYELGFACQGQTLTGWYGTGDELFDRWWTLGPSGPQSGQSGPSGPQSGQSGPSGPQSGTLGPGPEPAADLRRVIEEFRPEVIHSHNLPDWLTVVAVEVVDGAVPVIHDAHDLQSVRHTPYEDGFPEPADPALLEKAAIGGCAALVTVSEEMLGEIATRHALPRRTLVFPNYALARDLPPVLPPPDRPREGPPRLVYQGTLSTNGGHYDLREIFVAISAQGLPLDVYPARAAPEYEALAEAHAGLTCHRKVPPHELLQVLPEYDFGWAGFNASLNRAHLDTALPNKAFEYVGCGLPVLTLGHRALTRLVADEGVGVSLDSIEGLTARLADLDVVALRRKVAAARERLTVEANIDRVIGLYDEVAALRP